MKYQLDTHIHTISSGHAYSTVTEYAKQASETDLKLIAITDHAPKMPGASSKLHFLNLGILPNRIFDVEILKGVELNILNMNAEVDLSPSIIAKLDLVIASLHILCIKPMNCEDNTKTLINAMRKPYINIIGHPADPRYPIDAKKLVKASKETNTLLEINNNSLNPNSSRAGGDDNLLELILECKKENCPIILGSDSHYHTDLGIFDSVQKLLDKAEFPTELVLNHSVDKFKSYISKK